VEVTFAKMHGLGNDFVVVDWPAGQAQPDPAQVRAWADRGTGVGFDQLLTVTTPSVNGADADYRVFNADGGEVEQCGNGARCIVRFIADRNGQDQVRLHSPVGLVEGAVEGDRVRINLGVPSFDPADLPFVGQQQAERYQLELDEARVEFGAVSVGNPHAVVQVDSVELAPVGILGPKLEVHPAFPQRTNVGFMQVVDRDTIRLRVFERGVGETSACGTGAAAAVAVANQWLQMAERVTVELPGGLLEVSWPGGDQPLWLSGPATKVFEGTLEL
jgi:diaminopimelate epimerase